MCSADSAQRNRRFANFLNSVFQNAKNANFAIPKSPLQVSVIQLFRHVPKESCNDQRTTGRLTMDSRTSAIGGAAAGNLSTAGGIIGAAVINGSHQWQSSLPVITASHQWPSSNQRDHICTCANLLSSSAVLVSFREFVRGLFCYYYRTQL